MDRSFFAPAPDRAIIEAGTTGEGSSRAGWAAKPPAGGRALLGSGLFQRFGRGGLAAVSLCLLAGCVDSYIAAQAPQEPAPQPSNMARRPGVSPSGATVAVASFAGAPAAVRDRFVSAFDAAARSQEIVLATPDAADYLVRGYLNAVPEGEGTALTYVLDIFDAKKNRTQRVEDQILLKAAAPDPWSVVDDSALSAVAAKSAAALAAVLTNTPQAVLAAQTQASPAAQAEMGGRTIMAATPPVGPPAAESPGSLALH